MKSAIRPFLIGILMGAVCTPPSVAATSEEYNWKVKKENTRKTTAGYSDSMSYLAGDVIDFKVSCPASHFNLVAIRIGHYGGSQGKKISQLDKKRCLNQSHRDSRQWKPNVRVDTRSLPHGMYLFVIEDSDGYSSYIPIILRESERKSALLFSVPTMTMQAYNSWTGADTYGGKSGFDSRRRIVDFRQPFDEGNGSGKYLRYVHPLIVHLERLQLDVSYVADTDIHFDESLLVDRKAFISAGHDEYWTMQERQNVINAREKGIDTIFFGANAGYWNTRIFKTGLTNHLTMEIYKSQEEDPNKKNATIKFRDLGKSEAELTGLEYKCFPARGKLKVLEPDSFVFKGIRDFEKLNLEGLVGPEVDSLISKPPHQGKVVNLAEARVRCGTKWFAPRFGQMNMILISENGAIGGTFSTGTMGWVTKGLSASEKSDIGKFTRIVTENVLQKSLQSSLR